MSAATRHDDDAVGEAPRSTTVHVLRYMQANTGRRVDIDEIALATGLTRKQVAHALYYAPRRGLGDAERCLTVVTPGWQWRWDENALAPEPEVDEYVPGFRQTVAALPETVVVTPSRVGLMLEIILDRQGVVLMRADDGTHYSAELTQL